MEDIIIPNITDIVRSTEDTVDTFCSWTEALATPVENRMATPVENRMEERFLATSKAILKKITKSSADVDGLLYKLGSVTLSLASNIYDNVTITGHNLAKEKLQQAMDRKILTFDENARKHLTEKIENLHLKIKQHEDMVRKFKTVQGIELEVFKSFEKKKNKEFADTFLQGSLSLFKRVAGVEASTRVTIRKISDGLIKDITDQIVGRLTDGFQSLADAISKFPPSEKTEQCMDAIKGIDKVGIAYSLVKANSAIYFCPRVLEHLETFGWRERIPEARSEKLNEEETVAGIEAKLKIKNTVKRRKPGMLKQRRGMKINQKIFANNIDLAFGTRRKFLSVSWGFFHRSNTY